MRPIRLVTVFALAAIAAGCAPKVAQGPPPPRTSDPGTLKGVRTVTVSLEGVSSSASMYFMSPFTEKDMASTLTRAGIKVAQPGSAAAAKAPVLSVEASSTAVPPKGNQWTVELQLMSTGPGDNPIRWRSGVQHGSSQGDRIMQDINGALRQEVVLFTHAWQTANVPVRPGGGKGGGAGAGRME